MIYPYERDVNIVTGHRDVVRRPIAWLVASLKIYGELLESGQVTFATDEALLEARSQPVSALTRLCGDALLIGDFSVFGEHINQYNTEDTVAIDINLITHTKTHGVETESPDIRHCKEVILYKHLLANKWAILRSSIQSHDKESKIIVDGYFIGDVDLTEVTVFVAEADSLFPIYFPLVSQIIWKQRLHVPNTFARDKVFLAFLFVYYLQRHGNYLDLSLQKILKHKFDSLSMRSFLELHDDWLGRLDLTAINHYSHPFLDDSRQKEGNLLDLHLLGWKVLDVKGDGNCGYYAFLLGLENVGIRTFHVDTSDSLVNVIHRSEPWKHKVFELRHRLKEHSELLLQNIYAPGSRNYIDEMWTIAGAFTDVQVDGGEEVVEEVQDGKKVKETIVHMGLSYYIACPTFSIRHYYTARFPKEDDHHMNPYWVPHVLASMCRIRVIVYVMNATEDSHTWSMVSFQYNNEIHSQQSPHVVVQWITDLETRTDLGQARISDVEFNRVRTIELLYQTGYLANGEKNTQHFQFLRRVICHGVPLGPETPTKTLRELLEDQGGVHVESTKTGPSTNTVTASPPTRTKYSIESGSRNETDYDSGKEIEAEEDTDSGIEKEAEEDTDSGKEIEAEEETDSLDSTNTGDISKEIDDIESTKVTKTSTPELKRTKVADSKLRGKQKRQKIAARGQLTRKYNAMCQTGDLAALRMYFDSGESKYYFCNLEDVKKGKPLRKTLIMSEDLKQYSPMVVADATNTPDTWVGPTIADADTGDAPLELCTKVRCLYQQLNNPYCLTYSVASALFYCGFRQQASAMYEGAEALASQHFDRQIAELLSFMENLVPLIGQATFFGVRTKRHNRKKRFLTWENLFSELTPYPTVVIPMLDNGRCTHAFCVVDDLIFDSTTPTALKLKDDSVKWLFRERETTIYQAYRFNKKCSPPGKGRQGKTKGKYTRPVKRNWI